jgi:hypothetical protein
MSDGFGGLVVSILAEAVGFFGHPKNPQYAFLRRGSKIICPMSQICGMLKILSDFVNSGSASKIGNSSRLRW